MLITKPTQDLEQIRVLIAEHKPENTFLIYDENTLFHCDPVIQYLFPTLNKSERLSIPAGDQYKSMQKAMFIWDRLMESHATKSSLVLNVGGGMITDLGGFCASTFKRGVDFINIPTSLLGMVDASLGGKTGLNFRNSKNQIGVFANPKAIYLNAKFLNTLPKNELNSGISEMVKHELLFNKNALTSILSRKLPSDWTKDKVILENVGYKYNCVKEDYYDTGLRQALNFGHTIGHAIESLSHHCKTPILHGEAVMLGMIEEMKIAEHLYEAPSEIRVALEAFRKKFFPFLDFKYRFEKMLPFLQQDKKNDNQIRFSLIKNIAEPVLQVSLPLDTLANELA